MDKKKTAFVIRPGAYGDMIIISPLFKALRKAGYEKIILHTGKRGKQVLKHNPYIDEIIPYDGENKENPNVFKEWDDLEKKIGADYSKNFAESVEVNVAIHPRSPAYIYPKHARALRGGKNYYEATEAWAGIKFDSYKPDLYVTKKEEKEASKYLKKGKKNILWCLSGSGANKAYPYVDEVMGVILENNPDVHFITVGDVKCQILEGLDNEQNEQITNLAGKISFRETIILTKLVDLVVSPDTGTLHASGAWDTPKIGILGHTTKENITKYFNNDYSLEADEKLCECSPCYRLIYNHNVQCPIDEATGAAWCMGKGQESRRLATQIQRVINDSNTISTNAELSDMPQTHNIS